MNDTTPLLIALNLVIFAIALFVKYSDEIESFCKRKIAEKK